MVEYKEEGANLHGGFKDKLTPSFPFSDSEQLQQIISTFGEGEVGQCVQKWINEGAKCEVGMEEQKPCGSPAKASVDFEIPLGFNSRGPESKLTCLGHIKDTWMGIETDLFANGRIPTLTINGHGRA
ncbi:hypothetical protein HYT32_00495 [Candidatus Roizmanbacteria bacterium]|nr:hypothetical protein [Candidatus Roizmanbacteria bacterium]